MIKYIKTISVTLLTKTSPIRLGSSMLTRHADHLHNSLCSASGERWSHVVTAMLSRARFTPESRARFKSESRQRRKDARSVELMACMQDKSLSHWRKLVCTGVNIWCSWRWWDRKLKPEGSWEGGIAWEFWRCSRSPAHKVLL